MKIKVGNSVSVSAHGGFDIIADDLFGDLPVVTAAPLPHGGSNGLNLSTNHGLDLTCPHYEGLNLSLTDQTCQQDHSGQRQQRPFQQQQQYHPHQQYQNQPCPQQQGLNLSHNQNNSNFDKRDTRNSPKSGHSEVGLNLSIQNEGMNLTIQGNNISSNSNRGATAQYSSSSFQNHHYYYTTNTSGGYINLSTQKLLPVTTTSTNLSFENQRNSPLNLEHRSSPLNLTAPPPSNSCKGAGGQYNVTYTQNGSNQCSQVQQQHDQLHNDHFLYNIYDANSTVACTSNPVRGVDYQNQTDNTVTCNQGQMNAGSTSAPIALMDFSAEFQQGCSKSGEVGNDGTNSNHGDPFNFSCQINNSSSNANAPTFAIDRVRLFCSSCGQEFSSSNELNKHMEKHNSENFVEQIIPDHIFWTSEPFVHEVSTNQSSTTTTATSQPCQVSSIQVNHSNPEPKRVQEGGNTTAQTTSVRTVTKKPPPPQDSEVKCSQCGISFPSSSSDLKKHIDLVHGGRQADSTDKCKVCSLVFKDKNEFQKHLESHTKEKLYTCLICGAKLAHQNGLNRHIKRVHHKQQPYGCDKCGKKFSEKHDLVRHIKAHEKANLVPNCETCGKEFTSMFHREKHKCKPEGKFPCDICPLKLESKVAWGVHMWKHTKDPKYIEVNITPSNTQEHSDKM